MHPWLNKPGLAVVRADLDCSAMALLLGEWPVSKRV
jgi:hypothetical protein